MDRILTYRPAGFVWGCCAVHAERCLQGGGERRERMSVVSGSVLSLIFTGPSWELLCATPTRRSVVTTHPPLIVAVCGSIGRLLCRTEEVGRGIQCAQRGARQHAAFIRRAPVAHGQPEAHYSDPGRYDGSAGPGKAERGLQGVSTRAQSRAICQSFQQAFPKAALGI